MAAKKEPEKRVKATRKTTRSATRKVSKNAGKAAQRAVNTVLPKPKKAERVRYFLDAMTAGRFVTGRTVVEMADIWGLHLETVKQDAAEASRRIRDSVATEDEIRGQIIAALQDITQRCNEGKRPQFRTAVEALRVLAGVSGAEKPQKIEHSGDIATLFAIVQSDKNAEGGDSGDDQGD
jgi:hypothetical protein